MKVQDGETPADIFREFEYLQDETFDLFRASVIADTSPCAPRVDIALKTLFFLLDVLKLNSYVAFFHCSDSLKKSSGCISKDNFSVYREKFAMRY